MLLPPTPNPVAMLRTTGQTQDPVAFEARPCVVYLHGNCSSRLEVGCSRSMRKTRLCCRFAAGCLQAFDALPVLLPLDVSVFSMDLSGSGRPGNIQVQHVCCCITSLH